MAIDIKNISKSFTTKDKEFIALEDINLHVDDGELICLLGPSGCGKTTLLRLIGGLEEADSGEIYDGGGLIDGPSKDRGFIFQQYSLFPWLNVLDNVMFGLNLAGEKSKEENLAAAERYLDRVGLADFKYSYPHELSGGMKQRVAIIRSLLNHTPVLLMDEPFSAVDMLNRHSLQEQLIGVWKRFETTIIFVTHDVDEAVYLADKIVIMDKKPGRIKDIVEVPLERPRQRESREFLDFQDEIEKLLGIWEL
ncbi:NitT/TauT family transport system ATP-binding protein [Methanobrevibacter olleyae]|uniref:NitT/TauT family transport system ATP-binding protein n=1 Tax=Methanobrevibacter olleyae TaxID=294671 RepID=A0A1I4HDZ0_METOL|nr:ABC transporter ATP-binding protein [Methanobrevibacter olleyae]SFL39721.1 NitT/TauT family transport system ATP-binding protein [Methanobrevibacter olleyae]